MRQLYERLKLSSQNELERERDKLARAVALQNAAFDTMTEAVLFVDTARHIVTFNRAFARVWRIPDAVVQSGDDKAVLSAGLALVANADQFMEKITQLYDHPEDSSVDEVIFLDGRVLDRYSAPVRSPDGSIGARLWLFREVTEQRRAEVAEREARQFLDSIVENIPHVILVKDAEHLRYERINHAGEGLLGVSRAEVRGMDDRDFFPSAQAACSREHDRVVLDAGTLQDLPDQPITTPNGTRWIHTKKIPIVNDRGTPAYLLSISEDVTERKLAAEALARTNDELEVRVQERTAALMTANESLRASEQRLHQSQKMEAIGSLAAGVAHDFNNLLSVVLSYSEMLSADLKHGDPMRADLEEIQRAGLRAVELTRQLLAFSRQQVLQPQLVVLSEIVGGTEKMVGRLIGEDVELTVTSDAKRGAVLVDPGQMEQVIMNLVVNARDAMPGGGRLTIETAEVVLDADFASMHVGVTPGRHVMLAVSDTGGGMDKATQARMFEPFFTTKGVGKGTGLGLATVFGIVRQSGGTIWVASEPGKGTTFRVYFPRPTGVVDARASSTPAPDRFSLRGAETILLVEDEDRVRALARTILRRYGYTVLEAQNGGEAFLLSEQHPSTIHLLLTDVVMPRMNGRQLAERLLTIRPDMKLLYMSGYADDAIVRHGITDSTIAFLQKPITPETLARKVREVLRATPL